MLLKGVVPQFHDAHSAWLLLAMLTIGLGWLTIVK
jgi:hypothetical protein